MAIKISVSLSYLCVHLKLCKFMEIQLYKKPPNVAVWCGGLQTKGAALPTSQFALGHVQHVLALEGSGKLAGTKNNSPLNIFFITKCLQSAL